LGVADSLPTGAPQAQLFVGHMAYYAAVSPEEMKERFYQFWYYCGFSEKDLAQAMAEGRFTVMASIFGIGRALPALATNQQPVTLEEARSELRKYSEYIKAFTRERATRQRYRMSSCQLKPLSILRTLIAGTNADRENAPVCLLFIA